jgi:hypothetical protein
MPEFTCPNCNTVIESNNKADGKLVCPKCLDAHGKRFIMLSETNDSQRIKNMGDGFFEREI